MQFDVGGNANMHLTCMCKQGSFVELIVERNGERLPMFRVRRESLSGISDCCSAAPVDTTDGCKKHRILQNLE